MPSKVAPVERELTQVVLFDAQLTYVTTTAQREKLDALARGQRVSRAAILRDIVELGIKAYTERLA